MDEFKRKSWEMQIERLRRATPEERLQAAAAQREISKDLLRSGLLARFPDLTEAEIENRMGEIIFGVEVWRDICERRRHYFGGPGPA